MAKIRGIKPEFWTDSKMVTLKIPTRLFFIGLWNFCDDQGVFVWDSLELKMKIFPADNFDTTSALRELVVASCVFEFDYEGKKYGLVSNFEKHQRPDKRFLMTLIEPQELAKIKALVVNTTGTPCEHHDDIEGEGDVDIESDIDKKIPKGIEPTALDTPKVYGNIEVNRMLEALKGKIGIAAFADQSIERNMAKHCVQLLAKIGKDEFVRRLDTILEDSFKRKNCNRIKYVYNEIKAFIEPINKTIKSF